MWHVIKVAMLAGLTVGVSGDKSHRQVTMLMAIIELYEMPEKVIRNE